MDNDAIRHEFADVMALVQEQMRDLLSMEQKRAAITATGLAADDAVKVTVDAQRTVTHVEISETYLDDYEMSDLSAHLVTAAQAAAAEVEERSAALLAPLTDRRDEITSASGKMVDIPNFQDMLAAMRSASEGDGPRQGNPESVDGSEDESFFPTLRS